MSFLPPTPRATAVCLSDLHLLHHLRTGTHQSACALLIKLCPSGGPAWLPGAAVPARLLEFEAGCGRPCLRFTLSPLLHPQAPRGVARFVRPPPRPPWPSRELQGLRLWRAWIPSPPRPSHCAGTLGARKRLGCVSRHRDWRRSF